MASHNDIFLHVTTNVLHDSEMVKESLDNAGVKTFRRLLDVRRNSDIFNALKYKDPQTKQMIDLPDEYKEEIVEFRNFINWLQNNHGTIENFPIDIINKTNRNLFMSFLLMNAEERRGEPDGTVKYDVDQALESEEWNQLGRFAPSPAPSNGGDINTQLGRFTPPSITTDPADQEDGTSKKGEIFNTSTGSPKSAELAAFEEQLSDELTYYPDPLKDSTNDDLADEVTTTKLIDDPPSPTISTSSVNEMSLHEVEIVVEEILSLEKDPPTESNRLINSPSIESSSNIPIHCPLVQVDARSKYNVIDGGAFQDGNGCNMPIDYHDDDFTFNVSEASPSEPVGVTKTNPISFNDVLLINNSIDLSNAVLSFGKQSSIFDRGINIVDVGRTLNNITTTLIWGAELSLNINSQPLPISTGGLHSIITPRSASFLRFGDRTPSSYGETCVRNYPQLMLRDGHGAGNFRAIKDHSESLPHGRHGLSDDATRWGAVTSPSLFVDEFNRHNIDWFIVDITSSTAAEYDDDEVRMIATDTLITVASTSPTNTAGTVKVVVEGGFEPMEREFRQLSDYAFCESVAGHSVCTTIKLRSNTVFGESLPSYYGETYINNASDKCYEVRRHQWLLDIGLLIVGVYTFRTLVPPRRPQHHHILTPHSVSLLLVYELDAAVWGDVWNYQDVVWIQDYLQQLYYDGIFVASITMDGYCVRNDGNTAKHINTNFDHNMYYTTSATSWMYYNTQRRDICAIYGVINLVTIVALVATDMSSIGKPSSSFNYMSLNMDHAIWTIIFVVIGIIGTIVTVVIGIIGDAIPHKARTNDGCALVDDTTNTDAVDYRITPSLRLATLCTTTNANLLSLCNECGMAHINDKDVSLNNGELDTMHLESTYIILELPFVRGRKSSRIVGTLAGVVFYIIDRIMDSLLQACCICIYESTRTTTPHIPWHFSTYVIGLHHNYTLCCIVAGDFVADWINRIAKWEEGCYADVIIEHDVYLRVVIARDVSDGFSLLCHSTTNVTYKSSIKDASPFLIQVNPSSHLHSPSFYAKCNFVQCSTTYHRCLTTPTWDIAHLPSPYILCRLIQLGITLHVMRHELHKKLNYKEERPNAYSHASLFTSDKMIGDNDIQLTSRLSMKSCVFDADLSLGLSGEVMFSHQVVGFFAQRPSLLAVLDYLREIRLLDYVTPSRYIDVDGVRDIEVRSLRIGTFAAKTRLSDGLFVLLIFYEYGELKDRATVHSKIQLSDGGCEVHDDPTNLGGQQCIIHEEGIRIHVLFQRGLACIEMLYPSAEDIETLPRFAMTRNAPWDPTKYDKVRSRPTITEDPNAIQPDPSNGEHIPQSIDQSIRMIGEPLRQLQISHSSITTNIADFLSCDITNDTQLVQEYLASIALTSCNPQEPPLPVYRRTEPVGFPTALEDFHHTVWDSIITEELCRIEHTTWMILPSNVTWMISIGATMGSNLLFVEQSLALLRRVGEYYVAAEIVSSTSPYRTSISLWVPKSCKYIVSQIGEFQLPMICGKESPTIFSPHRPTYIIKCRW